MSRVAYVNGTYQPLSEAAVSVEDRGFQFADGVYEVVYLAGGKLIDTELHLDRLDRSLRELRIPSPISRPALLAVVRELSRRNRLATGLVYIQITRGAARREHAFPTAGTPPTLVLTLRRAPALPKDLANWTAAAITAPDQRWARCDIKSVSLLPNVLARQAAREAGAAEAILVDREGMVTEGAATSVWMVDQNGVLRTRPLSHAILPGCTRAALREILAEQKIDFSETAVTAEELRTAREIFITAATSFVKPILRLDGKLVGDGQVGPVAHQLFQFLRSRMAGNRL